MNRHTPAALAVCFEKRVLVCRALRSPRRLNCRRALLFKERVPTKEDSLGIEGVPIPDSTYFADPSMLINPRHEAGFLAKLDPCENVRRDSVIYRIPIQIAFVGIPSGYVRGSADIRLALQDFFGDAVIADETAVVQYLRHAGPDDAVLDVLMSLSDECERGAHGFRRRGSRF